MAEAGRALNSRGRAPGSQKPINSRTPFDGEQSSIGHIIHEDLGLKCHPRILVENMPI